jgi:hypothetical protein
MKRVIRETQYIELVRSNTKPQVTGNSYMDFRVISCKYFMGLSMQYTCVIHDTTFLCRNLSVT